MAGRDEAAADELDGQLEVVGEPAGLADEFPLDLDAGGVELEHGGEAGDDAEPAAPLAQQVAARQARGGEARARRCTPPRSRTGRSRGFARPRNRSMRRPASRRKARTSLGTAASYGGAFSSTRGIRPPSGVESVSGCARIACRRRSSSLASVWNESCSTTLVTIESTAFGLLLPRMRAEPSSPVAEPSPEGSRLEWSLEPCVHRQSEFPRPVQGLQPRPGLRRDVHARRRGPAALPEAAPPGRLALGGRVPPHPRHDRAVDAARRRRLHRLPPGGGHRARLADGPRAAHHPRRRVGPDRARPRPAHPHAQPLPQGHLRRPVHPPRSRHRPAPRSTRAATSAASSWAARCRATCTSTSAAPT